MKRSVKYLKAKEKISTNEGLSINEAIDAVKKLSYSKFTGSIELKVNLNIDPKDSEQNIRFTTELPHPTGKKRKVLALTEENLNSTYNSLEVIKGNDLSIKKIEESKLLPKTDFDMLITEAKFMPQLAKVARILGPKGLMPSPKSNTVGNVKDILNSLDKGQILIRSQPSNRVIHLVLGKANTSTQELIENFNRVIEDIRKNKPPKVKKEFISSIYLSATMGPSIKVNTK